ncbi:phosphoglycerate mutase-like protein [Multifurca ochricompacta]|uniref:Phosphoglycerate mutase-like protein n=1 Tax=Multifurca ochricompacta TaxID=376703 RepID=A0AAD4M579_9AGAM|nr:phosphoglycerate mutase-like protein [Multifurca ochricompacta]
MFTFTFIVVPLLLSAQPALSSQSLFRPWNLSSYCNAPHVNASHYERPEGEGAELIHLSVLMRHHKRAPVALVPNEREIDIDTNWDCSGVQQFTYDGGGARLSHTVNTPPAHPFAQQIWAGTCDVGQLTSGGFYDARAHGKDLWRLYHTRLGFLHAVVPSEISVRTTYVDRTKHVASGVLAGMDHSTIKRKWPTHVQPQMENSLGPSYKCPRADALIAAAQSAPVWQDVLKKHSALIERLDTVLGTRDSKVVWPSTFAFYQDVLTSRVCNDHPLPCNAAGDCVSEQDAAEIFELGNYEFDYLYHRAENAAEYVQLTFGVMFSELADALEAPSHHRLALYVAHDSSIIRLAAGLEIFPLRWPRLGSEVVIEVWKDKNKKRFVRVLYDGEIVDSLRWIPFGDFIGLLRRQVPAHLFEKCTSTSNDVEGTKQLKMPLALTVQEV